MLQSDLLSYRRLLAIIVQFLEVVHIMATFSRFSNVSGKIWRLLDYSAPQELTKEGSWPLCDFSNLNIFHWTDDNWQLQVSNNKLKLLKM